MALSQSQLVSLLGEIRQRGRVPKHRWPKDGTSVSVLGLEVDGDDIVLPKDVRLHLDSYIRENVCNLGSGVVFSLFDTIDSTNTAMTESAGDASVKDHLFVTEYQSAGRGRRGKVWLGDYGRNIAMTLGHGMDCKMSELGGLSCVVGLALIQSLEEYGFDAELKWPNDVWVNDHKLAGVLVELIQNSSRVCAVIGIGMNVNLSAERVAEIDQDVTSLRALGLETSRDDLVIAIYTNLARNLNVFEANGFAPFVEAFDSVHRLHNHPAVLRISGSERAGFVRGIDLSGGLIFEENSGTTIVSGGEVSLRPSFSTNP